MVLKSIKGVGSILSNVSKTITINYKDHAKAILYMLTKDNIPYYFGYILPNNHLDFPTI